MLVIFRLDKSTGASATYTFSKEIHFRRMILKGFSVDGGDPAQAGVNGELPVSTGALPIYLQMGMLGDNEVVFYQGRNGTLVGQTPNADNLIPLGCLPLASAPIPYTKMDLVLMDNITTINASDTTSISIHQIHNNLITLLSTGQLSGIDTGDDGVASDHGINIYIEFELLNSQDHEQTFTIPNAA